MRIDNILSISVNDFQLCDIIHGRRKCIIVELNSANAPVLINTDAEGNPIIKNDLVLPIPYSKIHFHSRHITLTGEYCIVAVGGIRHLYHKNPNISEASLFNGHKLCFDLGVVEQSSTDTDYTMS